MIKRIVVAGSREYDNYNAAKEYIDNCIKDLRNCTLIFVSGGCRGADSLGERYALENGYDVEIYKANWKKYGKAAGPIRNREMAEKCDYVICFWNGKSKGTKSMIEMARDLGKIVNIKYV